jgi:SAM-dependent methyltransferase
MSRSAFTRQSVALDSLIELENTLITRAIMGEPEGTGAWVSPWCAPAASVPPRLSLMLSGPDSLSGEMLGCASLWPFADNALAFVALQHVLDYALEPEEVLAEAVRCMRGHGKLVITGFRGFSAARLSRSWKLTPPRFASASSWARACRALGLADVEIKRIALGWPWLARTYDTGVAARVSQALPNFTSVYVLSARKRAIRARPAARSVVVRTPAFEAATFRKV